MRHNHVPSGQIRESHLPASLLVSPWPTPTLSARRRRVRAVSSRHHPEVVPEHASDLELILRLQLFRKFAVVFRDHRLVDRFFAVSELKVLRHTKRNLPCALRLRV